MSADAEQKPALSPAELRRRLDFSDESLRAECVVQTRRVRGPGGQHRNKTESAIRLVHVPTGVVVSGEERRSQHQNLANAMQRLRETIAIRFRAPLPESITWPERVNIRDHRLRVSETNPGYLFVLALALDALEARAGVPQEAAKVLDVSTSSFTRFLADHPHAWQEAQSIRKNFKLPPLRS
jgi:hypothetical protein